MLSSHDANHTKLTKLTATLSYFQQQPFINFQVTVFKDIKNNPLHTVIMLFQKIRHRSYRDLCRHIIWEMKFSR